ncbi:PilN domain-containing protein [Corallincola platygyrae]|uniref:PilN domain-containing protein n=1 Tax=Corallincola platygyrae TaxID=1193278 RepID=A0ABW4XUS3_9GAMM
MKQQINLYVESLRPQKESLSLPMVMTSWAIAVLLITVAAFWLSSSLSNARYQLNMARMTNKQLNQQVADLTRELQARQPSAALTRRKDQTQAELKVKKQLLAELQNRAPLKNQGFSQLMLELSKYHDDDIWLNGIRASETQLALSGFTRASHAVPRWVQQFQHGERLQQAGFSSLSMSRDENQRLVFTLSSLTETADE